MAFKATWRGLVTSIVLAAALKAPFAHGTELTEPSCVKRTGGTCTLGMCYSWRNAKCSHESEQGVQECLCKGDACSVDGECVDKGHCAKSTGGTCNMLPCGRWRRATCSPGITFPEGCMAAAIGFAATSVLTLIVLLLGCCAYCVRQSQEGSKDSKLPLAIQLLTLLLVLAGATAAIALYQQVNLLCVAVGALDGAGVHVPHGRRLIETPAAVDVASAVLGARVCVCPPGHCPVDGECVPHGDCPQIEGASSCDAYGNYSWASKEPSDGKCVCTNNMCADGHCGLRAECAKHIKGSSCKVFDCASWRHADCEDGVCVCGPDTCPVDGECVPKGGCARHIEGSSCQVTSCAKWRHAAACEDGTCVCGPGTCAVGGECVAAGGCARHIPGESATCFTTGECKPWTNAKCIRSATSGSCECPEGTCAVDGECVPPGGRPKYTGGTCHIAGCDAWRNADCVRGYCVCKGDTYAKDGACVSPDGCLKDTGGTCGFLGCDEARHAECKHGHCVCGEGTCAIGGRCVSKSNLAATLASDESSGDSPEPDRLTAALLAAGAASVVAMAVAIACRRAATIGAARPLREPLLVEHA